MIETVKSLITPTRGPWIALAFSALMLISAWTLQYGFGYFPCTMCYWQRDAHKLVVATSLLAIGMNYYGRGNPRIWAGLVMAALFTSFVMAFWHMGVEYSWWEGPKTCGAIAAPTNIDPADILASLDKKIKPPACKDAVWHFLGLSMAGWNALLSGLATVAAAYAIGRKS